MKSLSLAAIACSFALAVIGCGATSSGVAVPATEAPAAGTLARAEGEHIWRAKCGSCHTPIDPGSHAREALVDALSRHRKRLRLDPTQWQAVTEFLAPDR